MMLDNWRLPAVARYYGARKRVLIAAAIVGRVSMWTTACTRSTFDLLPITRTHGMSRELLPVL